MWEELKSEIKSKIEEAASRQLNQWAAMERMTFSAVLSIMQTIEDREYVNSLISAGY